MDVHDIIPIWSELFRLTHQRRTLLSEKISLLETYSGDTDKEALATAYETIVDQEAALYLKMRDALKKAWLAPGPQGFNEVFSERDTDYVGKLQFQQDADAFIKHTAYFLECAEKALERDQSYVAKEKKAAKNFRNSIAARNKFPTALGIQRTALRIGSTMDKVRFLFFVRRRLYKQLGDDLQFVKDIGVSANEDIASVLREDLERFSKIKSGPMNTAKALFFFSNLVHTVYILKVSEIPAPILKTIDALGTYMEHDFSHDPVLFKVCVLSLQACLIMYELRWVIRLDSAFKGGEHVLSRNDRSILKGIRDMIVSAGNIIGNRANHLYSVGSKRSKTA